jgi:hypothetical protein
MEKDMADRSSRPDLGPDPVLFAPAANPQLAAPNWPYSRVAAKPCAGKPSGDVAMALYELRTYTLYVGKMPEAVRLYQEFGFPAIKQGGHEKHLVGYFQSDTGTINQLVHMWKFADDTERRAHWAALFASADFIDGFAAKFRPLVMTQEVKLLHAAPWGPHP